MFTHKKKGRKFRWQRGLCEILMRNVDLLFPSKGGTIGWLAFPFMVVFEWIGPAIEVCGYLFVKAGFLLGFMSVQAWLIPLIAAIGLGMLLSVSALLPEKISFHVYPDQRAVFQLLLAAILENFGYRQLNSVWKLVGL